MPAHERVARLAEHVHKVDHRGHARAPLTITLASRTAEPRRQFLTEEQLAFMTTFGFLVLPGLMADTIDSITQAFSEVFEVDAHGFPQRPGFGNRGPGKVHNDTGRTWLGPFIDQHPTLCQLLDDPRIDGTFASLLGEDYTHWGSDGNYFSGNTGCEMTRARLLSACLHGM
jgi:hypothetical protein